MPTIKRKKRLIALALFMLSPPTVQAYTVYPEAKLIYTVQTEDWREWRAYYAWTMTFAVGNEGNTCYQKSDCYLVYGEIFGPRSGYGFNKYKRIPVLATGYEYLQEVFNNVSGPLQINGSEFNPLSDVFPENYPCVNLGYQIGTSPPRQLNADFCKGVGQLPPPPPPLSCSLAPTGGITLQHPTLSAGDLPGNKKTAAARVTCTRSASVKLSMSGLNNDSQLPLTANGALYSTLRINDTLAASGVTLRNVGSAGIDFDLSSTLGVRAGVPGGQYAASAVLMLNIL
ncbi:MrpH family fimbial adhesin [Serratia marcescens]|uniref:MrpH family fimbial adhesin n=1 Tax=Serratia marcescens TaxID=615 RepID=UPI0034D5A1F4